MDQDGIIGSNRTKRERSISSRTFTSYENQGNLIFPQYLIHESKGLLSLSLDIVCNTTNTQWNSEAIHSRFSIIEEDQFVVFNR
jgi:hypothetical protein